MSTTNPYTIIRQNIRYALEHYKPLNDKVGTFLSWLNDIDAAKASDRNTLSGSWIRVETTTTQAAPYDGGVQWLFTHTAQVVIGRPLDRMEQGLIEELQWLAERALSPLTRAQGHTDVPGWRSMTIDGGRHGIRGGDDKSETQNEIAWTVLMTVTTQFERLQSDMEPAAGDVLPDT